MMAVSLDALSDFLSRLFGAAPEATVDLIETLPAETPLSMRATMIRLAALHPTVDMLWFYRLHNSWQALGEQPLKPNVTHRNVRLLADFTAGQLPPLLSIMCAARGVHIDLDLGPFDSVEQEILSGTSDTYAVRRDLVVVCLSPHWLARYLGSGAMTTRDRVDAVVERLRMLLSTLTAQTTASVLVTNFPEPALAVPGGHLSVGDKIGMQRAIAQVNGRLAEVAPTRTFVVNVADAVFEAGGRAAIGLANHFRARIPFEAAGMVALARELASAIGHVCGKTPRAVVTDWDNTLWGGEIADAGTHGIVCGRDSAEGLGYLAVQQYLTSLQQLGVMLAGASRNDPSVRDLAAANPELALTPDDFASLQIGVGAKSGAIERIAADLGFGPEFMVFVDDSLFDLAEVVASHPHIDVVKAGPEPAMTLARLAGSRLFNLVALSDEDFARQDAAAALKAQREVRAGAETLDDFLRGIHIRVTVAPLSAANIGRVEQLVQKTNQFNLTTQRYSAGELRQLHERGAEFGVFAYEDAFGPQGIIAVAIVERAGDTLRIDSWLMSCRVLNRTVEFAVFAWIAKQAGQLPIVGEYRPTAKNTLVADLYPRLGFERVGHDADGGAMFWRLESASNWRPPSQFIELLERDE